MLEIDMQSQNSQLLSEDTQYSQYCNTVKLHTVYNALHQSF